MSTAESIIAPLGCFKNKQFSLINCTKCQDKYLRETSKTLLSYPKHFKNVLAANYTYTCQLYHCFTQIFQELTCICTLKEHN